MRDPHGGLDRFGAALQARDPDAVMSCLAADATLDVIAGDDRFVFTGPGIRDAVDALLIAFNDLKLTPVSRRVSQAGVVEESVLSGVQVGAFAGAEATTKRRVFVNVQLSPTWGPGSTLVALRVEADTRALFAQIAGTDDIIGVASGLIATSRERQGAALRITDETAAPLTRIEASRGRGRRAARHRRWVVLLAVAAVVLVAAAIRLGMPTSRTPEADVALAVTTTGPTATRSAKAPAPTSSRVAQPAPAARPVIQTVAPKAAPKVQRGKQVVLKSDVLFAFDSAALTPAATAAVTRVAKQVRASVVSGTIQINGYSDNSGTVAYDRALSRSRALAVARVLQRGLVGRRVTLVPQGFGQSRPIATNTTDAGRARNRRVTIVLPVPR